jgi:hypothetical protein
MLKDICFVICPIGSADSEERINSNDLLELIIKPVAEKNNYEVQRSDTLGEPGFVTNQIINFLYDSPLVIADLTNGNPNVFYELALRHVIDKPVIHMIKCGQKLPFDISTMRTIYYDLDLKNGINAIKELDNHIKSIKDIKYKSNNPISSAKIYKAFYEKANDMKEQEPSDKTEQIIRVLKELDDRVSLLSNKMTQTQMDSYANLETSEFVILPANEADLIKMQEDYLHRHKELIKIRNQIKSDNKRIANYKETEKCQDMIFFIEEQLKRIKKEKSLN